MSLFASAFETAGTAGPSSSLSQSSGSKSKNKRKRTSLAGGEKDDQLRSTQVNLERLIKSVESGDVGRKELKKEGRESMGEFGKRGVKGKGGKGEVEQSTPQKKQKVDGKQHQHQQQQQQQHQQGKKQGNKQKGGQQQGQEKKDKSKPKAVEIPLPPSPAVEKGEDAAGMTDLQKGMKAKLEGARFRWINEQLYSTPSTEAVAMMKKDPKIFADYHSSHRVQTAAWPSPPLPYIVDLISPLPKGTVVADLGCGDAGLARALVPKGKVVLSYDLVGDNGVPGSNSAEQGEGWVVQADFLTSVPLPGRPGGSSSSEPEKKKGKGKNGGSEIVDVVVCCLSLMGTNWVGGIYEVCRILKQGGTFHIAEVTSRFTSTEAFVEKVESFGFKLENEESPSTHFTLFRFTKTTAVPIAPVPGQKGWKERVREGEEILQACVYKKR